MREIKFRAWYDGNMYFVNELMFNSTGVYIATLVNKEIMQMYHYQTNDIRTIELMQYTGLKDSKWQEIYEGDIVRGYHAIVSEAPVFQVVWYEYQWTLNDAKWYSYDNGGYEDRWHVNWNSFEVIGNIYEHPELLPQDDFEHKTNQQ